MIRLSWPNSASERGVVARYPASLWTLLVTLVVVLLLAACATPRLQLPGGEASVPALGKGYFLTRDGRELPLRIWQPQDVGAEMETRGRPKAVIAALHGFNDYSNAFETTGTFLARKGIATFAFDQRGFGAGPQAGLWAGVAAMANDAHDFAAVLRERYPGVPLFLLGESMGAAVVMTAMTGDAQVDGIILLAPAVWARETMNPFQVGLLWLAAHTLPGVTLTGRGLRIRASDNTAMLRALSADPLVIKETRIDAMYGLTNLMDAALASASELRAALAAEAVGMPMLILYGRRDEVIPLKPVTAMLDRLPSGSLNGGAGGGEGNGGITLGVYDRGFHMLTRDLQGWRVLQDMEGWIADRDAPLPSGAGARARERLNGDD